MNKFAQDVERRTNEKLAGLFEDMRRGLRKLDAWHLTYRTPTAPTRRIASTTIPEIASHSEPAKPAMRELTPSKPVDEDEDGEGKYG